MGDTVKTNLGAVTAYADAVRQGYTGTREEFGQVMAGFAQSAKQVSLDAKQVAIDAAEVRQNKEDISNLQSQAAQSAKDAEEAKKSAENISGEAKTEIDAYVEEKKETLKGEPGTDGVTPRIGENGNWWIGDEDTGIHAQGADGYTPQKGVDYSDGQPGSDGKSAYQYAQDGGYTGTEEEFAQKLATEYPIDVQIDGTSIVGEDGVAAIAKASRAEYGLVKLGHQYTTGITDSNGIISVYSDERLDALGKNVVVTSGNMRIAVKKSMTDGKGATWTDTEKTGAWSRLTSIKTAMDEVAVAGAHYLLDELTELSVVLPDDALVGQEITVSWYNGDTPSTLSVAGNMLDFDYVPAANTRSEISCLWDGRYWSVIGMSQDVPVEENTEEVVASE